MFTALSEQLTGVLNRLRGRGVLSESDVTDALREIRRHLLEADVSFEVTRGFVERVRERAVGALQVKAVSPGQQVVKLVHDEIAWRNQGRPRIRLRRSDGSFPRRVTGIGEDHHRGKARATAEARATGTGARGGRHLPARRGRAVAPVGDTNWCPGVRRNRWCRGTTCRTPTG